MFREIIVSEEIARRFCVLNHIGLPESDKKVGFSNYLYVIQMRGDSDGYAIGMDDGWSTNSVGRELREEVLEELTMCQTIPFIFEVDEFTAGTNFFHHDLMSTGMPASIDRDISVLIVENSMSGHQVSKRRFKIADEGTGKIFEVLLPLMDKVDFSDYDKVC